MTTVCPGMRACGHPGDLAGWLLFPARLTATSGALAFAFLGAVLPGCRGGDVLGNPSKDAGEDVAHTVEAPGLEAACTPTLEDLPQEYKEIALQAAPCFSGYLDFPSGNIVVVPELPGGPCNSPFGCYDCRLSRTEAEEKWSEQVKNAVSGLSYPCLPSNLHHFSVEGGAATQVNQIWNAFAQCGGPGPTNNHAYDIILDDLGTLVRTSGLLSDEIANCLLAALEGVTFPCLAGFQLRQCEALGPDP